MMLVTLHAAYGRKYNTIWACAIDWHKGLDFRLGYGPYCSIRDVGTMKRDGYTMYFHVGEKLVPFEEVDKHGK
jgi:hypothetical protein